MTLRHLLVLVAIVIGDVCFSCSSLPTEKQLADAKAKLDEAKTKIEDVAEKAAKVKAKALKLSRDAFDALALARNAGMAISAIPPELGDWSLTVIVRGRNLVDRIERGEQVTREEIDAVLTDVQAAVGEYRKLGVAVPEVVDSAIELVRVVVGDVP